MGFIQHGACTIIPSRPAFSSEELENMVNCYGLNRLNQLTSFLTIHLKNASSNANLLQTLKDLDEVRYCALELPSQYEEWGYSHGLALKVSKINSDTVV